MFDWYPFSKHLLFLSNVAQWFLVCYSLWEIISFNPSHGEENMFDVSAVSSQSSLGLHSHFCKRCLMNKITLCKVCLPGLKQPGVVTQEIITLKETHCSLHHPTAWRQMWKCIFWLKSHSSLWLHCCVMVCFCCYLVNGCGKVKERSWKKGNLYPLSFSYMHNAPEGTTETICFVLLSGSCNASISLLVWHWNLCVAAWRWIADPSCFHP